MKEETIVKKYTSNLVICESTDIHGNHLFSLNDKICNYIKNGDFISNEIFEFFILEFITTNPIIKQKLQKNQKDFIIIMQKFLLENFKKRKTFEEINKDLLFITKFDNILDANFLFIPFVNSDNVWSLVVIENFKNLVKKEIRDNSNNYFNENDSIETVNNNISNIYYIVFEKLQFNTKENLRKILDEVENFFNFYFKAKFDFSGNFLIDNKLLTTKLFDKINYKKIHNFKNVNDTALVITKIIMESLAEDDIASFFNVENDYNINELANEGVCLNMRDIIKNKYKDALVKTRLEIDLPRNTHSLKNLHKNELNNSNTDLNPSKRKLSRLSSNIDSFDSRKKMNNILEDFFGNMKKNNSSSKIFNF